MLKAFWDILSLQLVEDPPNYTQALVLLLEIKEVCSWINTIKYFQIWLLYPINENLIDLVSHKLSFKYSKWKLNLKVNVLLCYHDK